MKFVISKKELADKFRAFARSDGETVWDSQVVKDNRRYSLPLRFTSSLANDIESGSLLPHEPWGWVAEMVNQKEWRLYLRVGEYYGESWVHHFLPPVEVAVKSSQEFIRLAELPKEHWWQAEFVCPFCGAIAHGITYCQHLMIARHYLCEPYRTTDLVLLIHRMSEREFNCNILNACIEGLKIKVPRLFVNAEWFRFAYWFVSNPSIVDQVFYKLKNSELALRYDG